MFMNLALLLGGTSEKNSEEKPERLSWKPKPRAILCRNFWRIPWSSLWISSWKNPWLKSWNNSLLSLILQIKFTILVCGLLTEITVTNQHKYRDSKAKNRILPRNESEWLIGKQSKLFKSSQASNRQLVNKNILFDGTKASPSESTLPWQRIETFRSMVLLVQVRLTPTSRPKAISFEMFIHHAFNLYRLAARSSGRELEKRLAAPINKFANFHRKWTTLRGKVFLSRLTQWFSKQIKLKIHKKRSC